MFRQASHVDYIFCTSWSTIPGPHKTPELFTNMMNLYCKNPGSVPFAAAPYVQTVLMSMIPAVLFGRRTSVGTVCNRRSCLLAHGLRKYVAAACWLEQILEHQKGKKSELFHHFNLICGETFCEQFLINSEQLQRLQLSKNPIISDYTVAIIGISHDCSVPHSTPNFLFFVKKKIVLYVW